VWKNAQQWNITDNEKGNDMILYRSILAAAANIGIGAKQISDRAWIEFPRQRKAMHVCGRLEGAASDEHNNDEKAI
jgi:hypothetical protein